MKFVSSKGKEEKDKKTRLEYYLYYSIKNQLKISEMLTKNFKKTHVCLEKPSIKFQLKECLNQMCN